jgi:hypothetical protein
MKTRTVRSIITRISLPTLLTVAWTAPAAPTWADAPARYECEPDWIEVVFAPEARVRLRGGELRDFGVPALVGVEEILRTTAANEWHRLCQVPEESVDELRARGIANTGRSDVPDLNNVFRLRIDGADVWDVAAELESLPGVATARPVPKPVAPPVPTQFLQPYRAPAAWNPSGMGHEYFAPVPNGTGAGTRVCDLEYSWDYDHADISKALNSQINVNVVDPFNDTDHGTAVIGMLSADDNGWGITGMCKDATLLTCGANFGNPATWNPGGAILVAIPHLPPGATLLLEQQWNYNDPNTIGDDLIPVEWYTNTFPSGQTANSVYMAIQLAAANSIYVIEAAGNGGYDLNSLTFAGESGAIIVGAGGAYAGGPGGAGNLERLAFSSFGFRVNVQGWGENVVTTGYGNLYSEPGTDNYDYTASFSGTSSASAHVAAAVACYSAFRTPSILLSPLAMRDRFILSGTSQVFGNPGHIGPRPDLMRLYVYDAPPVLANAGEFGDAPDGVLAYPTTGVVGDFHTTGLPSRPPDEAMYHELTSAFLFFGDTIDGEWSGNGGLPFGEFFAYDADECFDPGAVISDDGLLFPTSYTIDAVTSTIVPCSILSGDLGPACGLAQWGTDIDIAVTNFLPFSCYLNVLIDWNQDGQWGGVDMGCGGPAPELAVQNVLIPSTGGMTVPLSQLAPVAPIQIGSNAEHVWARFTLTDAPLPNPAGWNGSILSGGWGSFPIGETEDYLFRVGTSTAVAEVDAVERAEGVSAFPNPMEEETAIRFAVSAAGEVSVDVFDLQGRRVRRVLEGPVTAGTQQVAWDGRDEKGQRVSPGIYFGRVQGAVQGVVRLTIVR